MRQARAGLRRGRGQPLRQPGPVRPGEDLGAYPRDESADVEAAEREGVDLLWAPPPEEIYPEGFGTAVEVDAELTGVLEGDPEHRGPATSAASPRWWRSSSTPSSPTIAYFGQKDAQQAVVIRADGPRPRLPGRDRGAAHRARARRAGDELAQRLPQPRRAQRAAALSGRCGRPSRPRRRASERSGRRSTRPRAELRAPESSRSTSRRATRRTSPRSESSTAGRCWSPSPPGSAARLIDNVDRPT